MNSVVVRLLGVGCLLCVTSGIAQAQSSGISYTWAEAAYQNTDFAGNIEGDGVLIGGSLQVADFMHVTGHYETNSLDNNLGDLNIWGVGFGVHTALSKADPKRLSSDRFSAFFEGEFLSTDPDNSSGVNGWALDAGVRMINFTSWEVIASVGYEKFERIDGEVTLEGRLLYRLLDDLQLQAGIDWNDRDRQWILGARYNFPGFRLSRFYN